MKGDKSFSVLIPVYNCEKYIRKCLDSVLAQTYSDYEIIMIDDGSTDRSGDICDEYAQLHKNIKVVHQENMNVVRARGEALKHVRTDFFVFLDSDDFWDDCLLEMVNEELKFSHADIVMFRLKHVNEQGTFIREQESLGLPKEALHDASKIIFKKMITSSDYNNLVLKVMRSSLIDIEAYRGYHDVEHAEDLMQSLDYIFNANRISYIDKALYNYREVGTSITKKLSKRFVKDISIARGKLLDYLKLSGLDTSDNLKDFYRFYIDGVLSYLPKLTGYSLDNSEVILILEEINHEPLFVEAYEQIKGNGQKIHKRITLYLLSKRLYRVLILFERTKEGIRKLYDK